MGSTQQLFDRQVNLKVFATNVAADGGKPIISYASGYTLFQSRFPNGDQGYRIRGRVSKIEASVTFITNPIKLAIYNLGPDSRAVVQSKVGTKIVVEAGYAGNVKQVCVGSILWANTHKAGPDYITEIIASDGGYAITNAAINLSFSGYVPYEIVIGSLIDALAPAGITRGTVVGIPQGGYNNGIVLSRSPLEELRDICNKLDLHFSIQNQTVVILPVGLDKGTPPIEISPETGLIGIPELKTQGLIGPISNPDATTPTNMVAFKALIRPEIEMFQQLNIKSKFINGLYIAQRVTHDFDSWEGPFFTECECASA